jgi:hypothetical protein
MYVIDAITQFAIRMKERGMTGADISLTINPAPLVQVFLIGVCRYRPSADAVEAGMRECLVAYSCMGVRDGEHTIRQSANGGRCTNSSPRSVTKPLG